MRIIGITGSSGAGKSTICEILEKKYQAKIINADHIAKKLSKSGTAYLREIVEKFGIDILDENGALKRKKLAEIIYSDFKKRQELNQCTFKYIKQEIEKQIEKEKEASIVVIDAPLLFECELDKLCEHVIGVISKKELQIERIVVRDDIDYEHAERRINAQEKNTFYLENCDEIIKNNNDISDIEISIKKIMEKYNITEILQ